ncbi:MAG: sigma factor [Aureliella sp.]
MTGSAAHFATTQWTLVWKAASEDSSVGRSALEQIVGRNWQPLYSYARRRGLNREDAEDATQEFLHEIIRGNLLEKLDPARGKFRAFLLTAWKRFLIDDYRGRKAEKRGGQVQVFPMDFDTGERSWLELESRQPDPDRAFNVAWAKGLLEEANNRLRSEYDSPDRASSLKALKPYMTLSPTAADYQRLAGQLESTVGAVKVALHRLRGRYGVALREVVLETLDDPQDLDAEIQELIRIMASNAASS